MPTDPKAEATAPEFELTIEAAEFYRHALQIAVFASDNQVVHRSRQWPLRLPLKKGSYTIRLDLNGNVDDERIILDSPKHFVVVPDTGPPGASNELNPSRLYCSAPLDVRLYKSTTQVYSQAAIQYAASTTWQSGYPPENGSLFVFIRVTRAGQQEGLTFAKDFWLLDGEGKQLFSFQSRDRVVMNEAEGWLVCNAGLSPGLYFLYYGGDDPRQIPLYVLQGYHTQVFLTMNREPLFPTLRQFIRRERVFDPSDPAYRYADFLQTRLQRNELFIEEDFEKEVQQYAERAPMLALLPAYLSLAGHLFSGRSFFRTTAERKPETPGPNSTLKDQWWYKPEWFRINAENFLPDLHVLALLYEGYLKKDLLGRGAAQAGLPKTAPRPLKGIPLTHLGFDALKLGGILYPDLIKAQGLCDRAMEAMLADSCFTSFEPIAIQEDEFKEAVVPAVWSTAQSAVPYGTSHRPSRSFWPAVRDKAASAFADAFGPVGFFSGAGAGMVGNKFIQDHFSDYFDKAESAVQLLGERILLPFLESSDLPDLNWLGIQIRELLQQKGDLNVREMAVKLMVPIATVRRKLEDIAKSMYKMEFTATEAYPISAAELEKAAQELLEYL